MWIYIVSGLIAFIIVFIILTYNNLIRLSIRVDNAWSQIDNQLKRRADLIPNLVETVKGYSEHEKTLLKEIVEARNQSINGNISDMAKASDKISYSLNKLFALTENYPDLKANKSFERLQIELVGTEDKIAYARQFYNDSVLYFNQKSMIFPNNIITNIFKFKQRYYFKVDEKDKEIVEVRL